MVANGILLVSLKRFKNVYIYFILLLISLLQLHNSKLNSINTSLMGDLLFHGAWNIWFKIRSLITFFVSKQCNKSRCNYLTSHDILLYLWLGIIWIALCYVHILNDKGVERKIHTVWWSIGILKLYIHRRICYQDSFC